MTDNQTQQVFDLLTKCINGIQGLREGQGRLEQNVSELREGQGRLEQDVSELREGQGRLEQDVSELKVGQKRIEKEVRLNTFAVNEIVSEHFRLKIRVDEIEKLAA